MATLLNNELVCGNRDIAKRILQKAKPVSFAKGERIIEQGGTDDCVYFMVSGSVDVRINGRHIDYRNAPYSVGEMAAKRAGQARTADVVVVSQSLSALAISGGDFRMLMSDFESFNANLNNAIDDLSRKKISQLGEKTENKGWSWSAISGVVGVACAIAAGIFAWLAGSALLYGVICSTSAGIVGFVIIMLGNPQYLYRKVSIAAGMALIAYVGLGALNYNLTISGFDPSLPFLDIEAQGEQRIEVFWLSVIALAAVSGIFGYLDYRVNHARVGNSR